MLHIAMKSIPERTLGMLWPTPFAVAAFRRAWLRSVALANGERRVLKRASTRPGGRGGHIVRQAVAPATGTFGTALDPG